jgi:hypothetical protein
VDPFNELKDFDRVERLQYFFYWKPPQQVVYEIATISFDSPPEKKACRLETSMRGG